MALPRNLPLLVDLAASEPVDASVGVSWPLSNRWDGGPTDGAAGRLGGNFGALRGGVSCGKTGWVAA